MYRKRLALLMAALFVLAAAGCQSQAPATTLNMEIPGTSWPTEAWGDPEPSETQGDPVPTETQGDPEPSEPIQPEKEVLELEDFSKRTVYYDFNAGNMPAVTQISIPDAGLEPRAQVFYDNGADLDILVDYIAETLHIAIDGNWKVTVNYYDAEMKNGLVQFLYTVGEINTNRSIMFFITEGVFDTMSSMSVSGEIDEAALTDRLNQFKSKYVQGTRQLQEGEEYAGDFTTFTYYAHSDTLVYTYVYYFYDPAIGGLANGDWGVEVRIDENGNVMKIE